MYCSPNLTRRGTGSQFRIFSFAILIITTGLTWHTVSAQEFSYYIPGTSQGTHKLWHTPLPDLFCSPVCAYSFDGNMSMEWSGGMSFGPDTMIYILQNTPNPVIYRVNPADASSTPIFEGPAGLASMDGLVAMGGGIFYTLSSGENKLFVWDINAGTVAAVGLLQYPPYSELALINGMLHYISFVPGDALRKVIRLDPGNINAAEVVVEFPSYYPISGLTASHSSSLAIGLDKSYFGYEHIVSISLGDGTITDICKIPKAVGHLAKYISSMYEHMSLGFANYLDLDCDDSSLATETDYNSAWIDCLTEGGVPVCDHDLATIIDSPIKHMTITVANPLDGDAEKFFVTGETPGIEINGEGTSTLMLINEGTAKIAHFEAALKLVRYDDEQLLPTPGMRTIQVVFETMAGNSNTVSEAYVEVRHRAQVQFDLGPDVEMCENGSVLLDANIQFAQYEWSTGENSQTITVADPGFYTVTVNAPIKCPNADTIEVIQIPVIEVRLLGDSAICREEEATLIITTDAPFPIDVELLVNGGASVWLEGIEGEFEYPEWPYTITEYIINEVIASESACIEVWDDYQVIEVFLDKESAVAVSMCEGDSVQIANNWIHEEGVYPVPLQSIHGCDSMVTYTVAFNPSNQKVVDAYTCDPGAAGIFQTTIINQHGCDTIVTTTVHLNRSDTTHVQSFTCRSTDAGVFQQLLANGNGCDSLIISTIVWQPPVDSTKITVVTCDATQHGTFVQSLFGSGGCDSIVVTRVVDGIGVSTNLSGTSCDPAQVGVFEQYFLTADQCDSVVITTITYSDQTTLAIHSETCDPGAAGVFVDTFTAASGCDSIVTHTIALLPNSETQIVSTTCDPLAAGSFTNIYSNQYGCDSVVIETISLLPSSSITLTSSTCMESEAGTFVTTFTNQHGCDSIVTSIVAFVASDTFRISKQTCDPLAVEIVETLFVGQDGCDSPVIEETRLFQLPSMDVAADIDYNGYDVSCFGNTDASIAAHVNGVGPHSYVWSTGDTGPSLNGIGAGTYSVIVTDANGCTAAANMVLIEPEPFVMAIDVVQPDCVNSQFGEIRVNASGGVMPIQYAIDNQPFQGETNFNQIANGHHTVISMDANGCQTADEFTIASLTNVDVNLGEDKSVQFGETIAIDAFVNVPPDSIASIHWQGLPFTPCADCLELNFIPTESATITVTITDLAGCVAIDELKIEVRAVDSEVYFPNIFSPNGDGINDRWYISSGGDIAHIAQLQIYDRWGNLVYGDADFPANDPAYGWGGDFNTELMNQAVFVYKAIVLNKNGESRRFCGDITLIR